MEHKQQLTVLQQDLSRRARKVLSLGASCSAATEEVARLAGERDQLKVAHSRAEQQLQASQAQLLRCVSQAQVGGQQGQHCIARMGGEG